MKKKVVEILLITLIPEIIIFLIIATWERDDLYNPFDNSSIQMTEITQMPVDHSQFPELQKDFQSPEEVTEACLKCHNNIDEQLMLNEHWKWLKDDTIPGRGNVVLGKKNILNNFCIGINGNEKLCTKCHAGYGYSNKNFDFSDVKKMDCLVCHDNTGTFKKAKPINGNQGAGYPPSNLDLKNIAMNVGLPKRQNCGNCHYFGGGGNNVKHGDLEKALNSCTRDVDVHMATDGQNMSCIECHKTKNHNIPGNLPMVSASPHNSFSCTECHTDKPHKSKLLNDHYNQVACQTCHIPVYAKSHPTKIYWAWAEAGKLDENGKPLHFEKKIPVDSIAKYVDNTEFLHNITSDSVIYEYGAKHGSAILSTDVVPDYVWFNGYTDHFFIDDSIMSDTIDLNKLLGSYEDNIKPMDKNFPSKIYPVKIMRGNQIYDTKYKNLINPKLIGKSGSGAYWADFNWDSSAYYGMKYLGLNYSGQHAFINTRTYWTLNHEVAPANEALTCEECHSKDGRLKNMQGFYLPGRDKNKAIEIIGIIMIIGAIIGVAVHGAMRIFSKKKCV